MLTSNHDHAVTDHAEIEAVTKRLEMHPPNVVTQNMIVPRRAYFPAVCP